MSLSKVCPQCGTKYDAEHRFCTRDGASLIAENPNDSLIGAVIADRYHVLQKLGEGGMGEVYLAEHVRIKRKVAVKVMRRAMTADAVALGRFHREAENASQISHPNVATIYDFGETGDGLVYFAMEYVDGEPLNEVLDREGSLGVIRGCDIVRQVSDALSAAHALGILHRDLKPDNVMIGRTRVGTDLIKIVDFGISRVMDRGTQQFTSTGMVIGTPDYMSPEQLSGDSLDARTDIYALALIAFRMLSGSPAFVGNNAHESLLARLTKPAKRLEEARPAVSWPGAMQAVFDRALSADPGERYAEALDFAAALDGAAAQMPLDAEDQRYLGLLSQRGVTPARGHVAMEGVTPPTGVRPVDVATPPTPRPAVTVEAPPATTARTGTVGTPNPVTPSVAPPEIPSMPSEVVPLVADGLPVAAPSIARRGGTIRNVAVAAVVLAAVAWSGTKLFGGRPRVDGVVAAPSVAEPAPVRTDSSAQAAAPAAATVPSPAAPAAVRSDAVVARIDKSVFAMTTSRGHGAGFLVDTSGLVLTAANLVDRDSLVSVQLDGVRRVRARVLKVDRGVAVVALPPGSCRSCLALATDSVPPALGDSVVAVGSPETSGRVKRGVLKTATAQRWGASFDVGARNTGAPVSALTDAGMIVAIASRNPTGSTILLPAAAWAEVVAKARSVRGTAPADSTLLPVWPARRMSQSTLDSGATMSDRDIESYRIRRDGFEVLVMTPQVEAWRRAATSRGPAKGNDNPFAVSQPASSGSVRDPLQRWSEWDEYWRERRAVVIIDVSPEAAQPPFPGSTSPVDFKKGDAASIALLRDGQVVESIESGRVVAVPDPELYSGRRLFHSGVSVYAPDAFATGSKFRLEVGDAARSGKSIGIDLPDRVIERIRTDLGAYFTR